MKGFNLGSKNGAWAGDAVEITALHNWVKRHKPKTPCEYCGSENYVDAANISGKYKRDLSDYRYLCRRCHMNEDGRMAKLAPKKKVIAEFEDGKIIVFESITETLKHLSVSYSHLYHCIKEKRKTFNGVLLKHYEK